MQDQFAMFRPQVSPAMYASHPDLYQPQMEVFSPHQQVEMINPQYEMVSPHHQIFNYPYQPRVSIRSIRSTDPNSIYESDEFRMYIFKIKKCPKSKSHDWTNCPFAHKGEKARRRDPRKHHYSAFMCPNFRNGECRSGESCEYSHGVFEYWLHPAKYRTRFCTSGMYCLRKVCFFAHTVDELRHVGRPRRCQCQHAPQIPVQEEINVVTPSRVVNERAVTPPPPPPPPSVEVEKSGEWDLLDRFKGFGFFSSFGEDNIWSYNYDQAKASSSGLNLPDIDWGSSDMI